MRITKCRRGTAGAFVDLNRTASYTTKWLQGAKQVHGLDIDFVGLWNERSPPVRAPWGGTSAHHPLKIPLRIHLSTPRV